MKICSKCQKDESQVLFKPNRSKCINCINIVRRASSKKKIAIEISILKEYKHDWYIKHKDDILQKDKIKYIVNRENRLKIAQDNYYKNFSKSLIRSLKQRAKNMKIDFEIDSKFIDQLIEKQNNKCILTNIEFSFEKSIKSSRRPLAPSIDRINPKLGYTKDNVRLVCVMVNLSLNEFGDELFKMMCNSYVENTLCCR